MKKITFVGDIMCEKPLLKASRNHNGQYNFSKVFSGTKALFSDSALLIGNLETPLAGESAGYTNELYSFNTPDEFARAIKNAGFSLVSTANNHCLDRGPSGLRRTIDILDALGIRHTGTWRSTEERSESSYFEMEDGTRIAIIAYTYGTNYFVNRYRLQADETVMVNLLHPNDEPTYISSGLDIGAGDGRLKKIVKNIISEDKRIYLKKMLHKNYNSPREDNYLNEDTAEGFILQLQKDIAIAKTKADIVIFYPHIGGQFNLQPGIFTQYILKKALMWGVDAVIASHPHIIQKAEMIAEAPCFYSIGNFSISPSSVYLLHESLPDYGLAVNLYVEKKIVHTSFSILKMVESITKSLTVFPIDDYSLLLTKREEINKLKKDVQKIYKTVTGNTLNNEDVFQKEYPFY